MKKTLFIALALMGSMIANAADFNGRKFYINPGHGGHDSDDRPTALPCGVPMFYESDGTLSRGLALKEFLEKNNAKVKISRTTNTSADDLGLSTIASYSNSYGGYFMSLHSNGANASANYVVAFYRTSSSAPTTEVVSGSKKMSTSVANWHDAVTLSDQTYETPRAIGDWSFYGYNLGVLKTNSCPGYLVESWFHDYRPEALRMKSDTYNKFLAWQIARAAMEYPGATGDLGSVVQGDIRDLSKSCGYTNYTTRNRDKYKAVEGAKVRLLSSTGAELQSMTTDNYENGYYAFFDLKAGTYTIEVSKTGYKTETKTVTFADANSQKQVIFNLVEGSDTGINLSSPSVDFGSVVTGDAKTATITVSGSSLTSAISVSCDSKDFVVSPTSLPKTGGKLTINFTAKTAGVYSATVTLKSGSFTKTFVISATAKNPVPVFEEVWNFSENSGVAEEWAKDKALLRNMTYGDGKLFVVNPSATVIYVVDAKTGKQLSKVCTEGVSGGVFKVMDVQYVDGKLLATSLYGGDKTDSKQLKVYVWNNGVDAAPDVMLNTTDVAGFGRIGDTFSYKGTLAKGTICYAAGSSTEQNKIVLYSVTNGVASTTPTQVKISEDGTDNLILGISPRVVPDGDNYWVMGQNYYPSLVTSNGLLQNTVNAKALNNELAGNEFTTFTFKGSEYAFATTYIPKSESSDGNRLHGGRAVLLDGADGWADATNVGEYPAEGLGQTRNTSYSTKVAVNVEEDRCIEMWVLVSSQGVAYYRYEAEVVDDDEDDVSGVYGDVTNMSEVWNYSDNVSDKSSFPAGLFGTGALPIRSIAYSDGKLYVLQTKAFGAETIHILDAYTGKKSGELDATGLSNATVKLSSLVALDGKIFGSSASTAENKFTIYRWDSDESSPVIALTLTASERGSEAMGAKIAAQGTINNGKLIFTNQDASKLIYFNVVNGAVDSKMNIINLTTDGSTAFVGDNSAWGASDVMLNNDGTIWVDGYSAVPTLFSASGVKQSTLTGVTATGGSGICPFSYNGADYYALMSYNKNSLTYGRVEILDADGKTILASYPSAGLGATANGNHIGNVIVNKRLGGYILDIWVCVNGQGVAYYTCGKESESTGVDVIIDDVDNSNAPVEYYNLQGVRVENPANGVYIRRQGSSVSKVLFR